MKALLWTAAGLIPWSLIAVWLWKSFRRMNESEKETLLAARMRREECRLGALADLPEPRGMVQEKKRRYAAIGPRTSGYTREIERG